MKRGTGLRPRTLLALAVAAGLIVYRLAHLGHESATGAVTSSGGFHSDHSVHDLGETARRWKQLRGRAAKTEREGS